MSKDKRKYLEAYIPEVKPKETPKRSGMKSDGRLDEIEEAIRAFNDLLTKQNRDNLDAMYNIDMDNMSSSMRRLFQSYDDDISEAQASIKTMADANGATIKLLAQWFGKDENGEINQTSESILKMFAGRDTAFNSLKSTVVGENGSGGLVKAVSEVRTQANNNGSAISALQSAVYTTDADGNQITALAKFQNEVSTTYAKTSQFSTFKSEIEGSVSQTLAGFTTEADKTYAKTSQVAAILGEDGNVSFAEIAAGVSDDESFVKLVAENIVLDGDVYITGKDAGETMMRIWGNRITLNHLYEASLGAAITWWYDGIDTGEAIGNIYSDRDTWLDDDLRYSLRFFAGVVDGYPGAIILNSEGAIRQEAGTRICLAAPLNVRIEAQESYFIACTTNFGGIVPAAKSFVFCTDGIYYTYLNSDGEIEYECILPIAI